MTSLSFDGCDCLELARTYGTPLYVLSEHLLRQRLRTVRSDFLDRHANTRALYASKALQTLDVCRIVASEGLGLDVVSGGELYAAKRAGFPLERVYFHGNSKGEAELRMAVEEGIGRVVVDSLDELLVLNRLAVAAGRRVPILFRITPGVNSHTHQYIATGQIDSKFGIPLDPSVRDDYIGRALSLPGVELLGFHFHVGSQLHSNQSHLKAIAILFELLADLRQRYGYLAAEVNLGGGFGVCYTDQDEAKGLAYFTDAMMAEVDACCARHGLPRPVVVIEPGRWLVAEAGITLYSITSVKRIPGIKTFVAIDGGMPDNPRPALYAARYSACIADRPGASPDSLVTVAGKCCESGDILIEDIHLPDPVPGDTLAVFATGAYNHAMASTYNRLPRPAMVLVDRGSHRLSVRRETYEDLLLREV